MKRICKIAALALLITGVPALNADPQPNALDDMNVALEMMGASHRVVSAEYLTAADSGMMGQTIFANNRGNKQLTFDFVPGDPRRVWGDTVGTGITWINDASEASTASGLVLADTSPAISRAMQTWQDESCSNIPLIGFGDFAFDFGVVQNIVSGGASGSPFVFADITQAGWLAAGFFDAIGGPGASNSIIGVTFTFRFINPDNSSTDIDNNGVADAALREVYYNDNFFWAIDGNIDVETVALHENGHALSQGHFGKISRTDANGKIHFSPRAVMNAAYSGVQQSLTGTDRGGHCSNWGSWPNN